MKRCKRKERLKKEKERIGNMKKIESRRKERGVYREYVEVLQM